MALYIDNLYASQLAIHLERFKKLDTGLYNFRCPVCGDSAKNKTKCRGFIFTKSQSMFFTCHNCNASMSLGKFIEQVNPLLAMEYRKATYLDKQNGAVVARSADTDSKLPDFGKMHSRFSNMVKEVCEHKKNDEPNPRYDPFSGKLERLDNLPETHLAVQYCLKRKLPKSQYHKMYFIPHIVDITRLPEFKEYRDRVKGKEPRIVLPFFDINGTLSGVTCRDLGNSDLRYVTLKVEGAESLIFGVEDIDWAKTVYVTEGGFDSMFLENCIAVGGTGIQKLSSLGISKEKMVIIFDNQSRHREVVNIIDKTIKNGYTVLIWSPKVKQKDINSMMLAGENYLDEVKNRCYNGLRAQIAFNQWKKI